MAASKHIKVLLIEDNPGDVRLIWEIFSEIRRSPFYLSVADTLKKGLETVEKEKPDVILLDLGLPDSNGIYTLNRVRDRAVSTPIVVMTGLDDEVTAIRSLNEGAQDYLVKGRTDSDLLKKAVIYAIERQKLFSQISAKERFLKDQEKARLSFISMVFHELLFPVTAIKLAAGKIEKAPASADVSLSGVKVIKNNTIKIFSLLDDMINTRELRSGEFTITKSEQQLSDITAKCIEDVMPFAEEKGCVIETVPAGQPIRAMIDPYRFSQALVNMINNGVKFSSPNGKITVKMVLSSEESTAPDEVKKGAYAVIEVRDEGEGISKEEKEEIFMPFFESEKIPAEKHERIGLGLMVTKHIISAHNGYLWAESEGKGKGASFYAAVPLA